MDAYILRAINEHKELTEDIDKLNSLILSCDVDRIKGECKVDVEDYTLMRMQLSYMINYHSVLEARLIKHGIVVDGNKYYEDVTDVKEPIPVETPGPGYDFNPENHLNQHKKRDKPHE